VASKSRNRGKARSAPAGRATPGAAPTSPAAGPSPAGTPATGTAQLTAADTKDNAKYYPGQQFGLPEHGSGSVSNMLRRLMALLIDWLLSMAIAYWWTHSQFWTIAVFTVEVYVLTALGGSTVGKRLMGIRVVSLSGGPVGLGWSLVRTAILLTVIPPLLTDRDLRGMHDRAANTIVVRI